jgi:urease accessory protein
MTPTADMTTRMGTEPLPLLGLIWLASPALPVGSFSYSDGLEAAIDHGMVSDEDSCAQWLIDQLWLIQVRGDMAVIAQAMQAWTTSDVLRLQQLAQWVMATRESAEARLQTEQMGRSMLDWLRNLHPGENQALPLLASLPPNYPLAMSLALTWTGSTVEQALQAYAFGWAENMTQAALKAVPLGQSGGQRVLARLVQDMPAAVQASMQLSDDDRQAFSPMWAILSSRHETQYSRLFRS